MLMEEGWLPKDSGPISLENMVNHGSSGTGAESAECSSGDASMERRRAWGGGAYYQTARRWSPIRRRGYEDLIGEPIDRQRGRSGDENPRTLATRQTMAAKTSRVSEDRGQEGDPHPGESASQCSDDERARVAEGGMLEARSPSTPSREEPRNRLMG